MTAVPLPPRPDPQTGEPRPPAAPLEPLSGTGKKQPERGEEHYLGEPPPGMGPTLEGHKFSTKNSLKAGVALFVVCIIIGCIKGWAHSGNPFDWVGVWWVWLVIAVLSFGIPLLTMRGDTVLCGADWLKKNSAWIELYELTEVKVRPYGVRFFVDLTDHANRKLSLDLVLLQTTPLIWDYVYNGLVHSVASGKASANKIAVGKLGLPLPAAGYMDE